MKRRLDRGGVSGSRKGRGSGWTSSSKGTTASKRRNHVFAVPVEVARTKNPRPTVRVPERAIREHCSQALARCIWRPHPGLRGESDAPGENARFAFFVYGRRVKGDTRNTCKPHACSLRGSLPSPLSHFPPRVLSVYRWASMSLRYGLICLFPGLLRPPFPYVPRLFFLSRASVLRFVFRFRSATLAPTPIGPLFVLLLEPGLVHVSCDVYYSLIPSGCWGKGLRVRGLCSSSK